MSGSKDYVRILMADDDEDDRILTQAALDESNILNPIDFVEDGEELMLYLRREGQYTHLKGQKLPGLILLDLNMPRKDGREVIQEIRADERLRHIPIVVLTTSQHDEDIIKTYNLGANSYITKPVTFDDLVRIMEMLRIYWLETVELPRDADEDGH